jgi:hypothetical protein
MVMCLGHLLMLILHMDDIVFVHYGFHGPKSITLLLVFFFHWFISKFHNYDNVPWTLANAKPSHEWYWVHILAFQSYSPLPCFLCFFFSIGFFNVSILLNSKYLTFIYFCIIPKTYTLNFLYEFCKPLMLQCGVKRYNSSTSDNNLPICSFIVTTLQVQII